MNNLLVALLASILLFSCNHNPKKTQSTTVIKWDTTCNLKKDTFIRVVVSDYKKHLFIVRTTVIAYYPCVFGCDTIISFYSKRLTKSGTLFYIKNKIYRNQLNNNQKMNDFANSLTK